MVDFFNTLDKSPLLVTGQTTDYTPSGRTCTDDGGEQRGKAPSYTIYSTGQYSGTTSVTVNGKTDTHSNGAVLDDVTGCMWSQTVTDNVYGAGTENLLWDDTGGSDEDIFEYCDQANLASLSGHTDWRIPNYIELHSIMNLEASNGLPDATAFPSFPLAEIWTSTTRLSATTQAYNFNTSNGLVSVRTKTSFRLATVLVRGGV